MPRLALKPAKCCPTLKHDILSCSLWNSYGRLIKASWGMVTITDQITTVTIQACTTTPHLHSPLLTCNVALFSVDEINVLGNPSAAL